MFQASLEDGSHLDGTIELLGKTATIIEIYRDRRPITSLADERLAELENIHKWFTDWRASVEPNEIFSRECCEDVESMLVNLHEVTRLLLARHPNGAIIPATFNSNSIENFFCQQRGFNGNKTNPTYADYCSTVNSIVLTQPLRCRARKSNAGQQTALPISFYDKV